MFLINKRPIARTPAGHYLKIVRNGNPSSPQPTLVFFSDKESLFNRQFLSMEGLLWRILVVHFLYYQILVIKADLKKVSFVHDFDEQKTKRANVCWLCSPMLVKGLPTHGGGW
jgi:hypothetical protein